VPRWCTREKSIPKSEAGESLSDASTITRDDDEARDAITGDVIHCQTINLEVLTQAIMVVKDYQGPRVVAALSFDQNMPRAPHMAPILGLQREIFGTPDHLRRNRGHQQHGEVQIQIWQRALSSPGFIDTAVDSKPVASAESRSTQVHLFMASVCLPKPKLAFAHLQHIAYAYAYVLVAYGLSSPRPNHEHVFTCSRFLLQTPRRCR
jgi:hypothetical protein